MSDEGKSKESLDLDGDGSQSGGSDDGGSGGDQNKNLGELGAEELVSIIKDLRSESAKYRTRASKAEGQVGNLTQQLNDLSTQVQELKDANKTAEEKEAEQLQELEARAARAEKLAPYQSYVESRYKEEVAFIEDIDEGDKRRKTYTDLLDGFAEDDILGRLRAVRALRAAEGVGELKDSVAEGDEGNPAETGGGDSKRSREQMLSIMGGRFLDMAKATGSLPSK